MYTALIFLICYLLLSILLSWHDIRTGLLPDSYTCPLLWTGLAYHLYCLPSLLPEAVKGAIAGYLGFAVLYWGYRFLRGKEGMGYGDVKMLAALGAWHGWQRLPALVFIAALLACSYALIAALLMREKQALKNPLPFGPFMAAAGLIAGWQNIQTTVSLLAL